MRNSLSSSIAILYYMAWHMEICTIVSFNLPRIQHQRQCQSQQYNYYSPNQFFVTKYANPLHMSYGKYGNGRSSPRYSSTQTRTKRQERVGHVVRTELATILHKGHPIKHDDDPIEDELRRRINIVHADVSPDLRQARVTISVMAGKDRREDVMAKRRAYAWLVRSTKSIRHALAQRMKHMKASPDLTFAQVDVGAAVDVMQLIEKVSRGYKREDVMEMDFEGEFDEDEDGWIDENYEDGEVVVVGEDGSFDEEADDDDWVDYDEDEEKDSVEGKL